MGRRSLLQGKAPWVWEDDIIHAESGLALECRTEKCGATHCWQRWLLLFSNLGAWHPSLGPTPQTESAVPAWSRGPRFASAASPHVERSRQGRGAEVTTSFTPSHVYIVRHQTPSRQGASRQQLRLQSGLPGLLRASSHNRKQCPRPLSFTQNIGNGSRLGPSQPWLEQE